MKQLGVQAAPISTQVGAGFRAKYRVTSFKTQTLQVVSRLHHADFLFALASIASSLERLGKEIRNLQRSEIGETSEGFGANQVCWPAFQTLHWIVACVLQVGSSTMPQKRNPHKSERICGLARIVRAQLAPGLETVSLVSQAVLSARS
jgi:adenylosuccinate lyase